MTFLKFSDCVRWEALPSVIEDEWCKYSTYIMPRSKEWRARREAPKWGFSEVGAKVQYVFRLEYVLAI